MNSVLTRAALVLLAMIPATALADEVTCESKDSRQVECDLDTRGEVRLVRQLSKSPCTEGRSWGANRHSIWVKDGCRGVFASDVRDGRDDGYGRGDDRGRDDRDGRGRDDDRDDRDGRDNDRGRDDGRGHAGGGGGDNSNLPDKVTCESRDSRQVECDMNTRGSVRVSQQLSKTACVEGKTWGLNRHSVWVSGGCRAVFVVDSRVRDSDYRQSGNDRDVAPDAAVTACAEAGRGRGQVLSTSALKPGFWEVVLRFDDGRYVCNVDDRGRVQEFSKLR